MSTLVDSLNNAKPQGATESSVLGPFFTEDAHDSTINSSAFFCLDLPLSPVQPGDSIASEGKGDYLFVEGRVTDIQGKPVPNAIIDTWETDGHGLYDTQYDIREGPDCRGRLRTAEDGSFSYRAVV